MECYEEMYNRLFNKVTDVIEELKRVQQETEEIFVSYKTETPDNILHIPKKDDDGPDKEPPKK